MLAAFGCQVDTARHPEWLREADGLALAALVTILQLERKDLGPNRQPSGLMHTRQRWQAMPDGGVDSPLLISPTILSPAFPFF